VAQTEQRRQQINRVIRAGGIGDRVVDFDRALRDPADPSRLAPTYNGGDGLHPSSSGYRRMARAVDLSKLRGPAC
jgi:lysophospholipase L1-like esterase